jgi:hypothetical protein
MCRAVPYAELFGLPTVQGLSFGVDALKSLILSLAVVDRRLTVAEAVAITRLGIFNLLLA